MPYLIGIPAPQLLRGLEHMGLEEVVFVDLDAGTCRLGSQDGPEMDSALLPWSHHLQAAFQVCFSVHTVLWGVVELDLHKNLLKIQALDCPSFIQNAYI